MRTGRRAFVGSGLALAGLAGTITGLNSSAQAAQKPAGSQNFASFGWEVVNLDDNGADVYFEVTSNMVLNALDTDVAFMITALPGSPGFTEVLCRAAVSRGGIPKFYHGDPGASFVSAQSPNFSKTHKHNPNHLERRGRRLSATRCFLQCHPKDVGARKRQRFVAVPAR